jgi:large subunit ribosomal protein L32
MAVPKKRKSPARRDQRRAHHDKITAPNLSPCPGCSELVPSHRMCPACGEYKGRKVRKVERD